jgi:hypothetical protein
MIISNLRCCLLLVAVAYVTGCGKQERIEAVQFAQALDKQKDNFASANTVERDLVTSARAWCGGITANGAGRGVELDQNAVVAAELAKSTVAISFQLSQVRQAIDGQPLKTEYPRSVRNVLTTQLTKRQRLLQGMREWLEQSAPQFLEYRHSIQNRHRQSIVCIFMRNTPNVGRGHSYVPARRPGQQVYRCGSRGFHLFALDRRHSLQPHEQSGD